MLLTKNNKFIIPALILLLALIPIAFAQSQDSPWSAPTNLSRSGAAAEPHIVVDSDGDTHVVWLDEYDGLTYARKSAGEWSDPAALNLPFSGGFVTLKLVADQQGRVHAVWIDDEGVLYYSRVRGESFGSPNAWWNKQLVALSAADVDLVAAPDGSQHLAYLRSEGASDFPAGVYTLIQTPGAESWSNPKLLYQSAYFRGLQPSDSILSIAAGENDLLYISWNDPAQERIYLAASTDAGRSWGERVAVDRRLETDGFGAVGPSMPIVTAESQKALLLWNAGHQGATCSVYFIFTADAGASWSDPELLPEPFQRTCPESMQLLEDDQGDLWLLASTPSGIYLLAWDPTDPNGVYWSTPQLQPELNGFTHPDTFRQVALACQRAALTGDKLQVVGCETGADTDSEVSGDIWTLSRPLGDHRDYFPTPTPTPLWSTPAPLTAGESLISQPALVADTQGRLHAFWTQQNDPNIYYSLWDGSRWSRPIQVLISPGGTPLDISAALHPAGDLILVWSDPAAGALLFSAVPLVDAIDPGDWRVLEELPITGAIGVSPQVQVASDGVIYIAYAVPVNEGRGVYSLRSAGPVDFSSRLLWNAPELVFDAVGSGWDLVADTRLTLDPDGVQHMLWTRYALPPVSEPLGLYYAHSISKGSHEVQAESDVEAGATESPSSSPDALSTPTPNPSSWSQPLEVDRTTVVWSQILAAPDGTLHRAWQQALANDLILWHSYSLDGGDAWSEPARITGFRSANGPASLALDVSGELHLLQIGSSFQGPLSMQRWQWQGGETWTPAESQELPGLLAAGGLTLLTTSHNEMAALYTGQVISTAQPEDVNPLNPMTALLFNIRSMNGTNVTSTPLPTFTPAPHETQEQVETTAIPSPTPTLNLSAAPTGPLARLAPLFSNRWTGLALGAIPALLIVGAAFIWGARKLIRRH